MLILGNLINLESVGTGLDPKDGMTYPMTEPVWHGRNKYQEYDYWNGIHIDDIETDGDWVKALDYPDKIRVGWVSERLKAHFGIED